MIHNTSQKGFTLLLASLIASLLTSMGIAMYTIAQKEIVLSSLGRDSQYAFYAADSGAECALYWDFRGGFDVTTATHDASCNGTIIGEYRPPESATENDLVIGGEAYEAGVAVTDFTFEQNGYCVIVEVTKYESGSVTTTIDSRGYSTGCDEESNPRRLERAVRMKY